MTYEDYAGLFIADIKEKQATGNIYIWGSGLWGRYAKELLDKNGIGFSGFIDNNVNKIGNTIEGVYIYAPSEIPVSEAIIIVALQNGINDVKNQCCQMGIAEDSIMIFDDLMKAKIRDTYKNTEVIDAYECAWPGCNEDTINDIIQYSGIDKSRKIFEIGAGAGKVADMFLKRGYFVDLLEISEEQVSFLKKKYEKNPQVRRIDKGYFEEYTTSEKYDLIYLSGVAHWLDLKVSYPKMWDMLVENGTLAVFYTNFEVIYRDFGIWRGLNEIKRKYLPNHSLGYNEEELQKDSLKKREEISRYADFREIEHKEYQWNEIYEVDRYISLVNSSSAVQLMSIEARERYLEDIREYINQFWGGKIEVPMRVWLDMTKKCK